MRCLCIRINDMENTRKGWIFNEEGVYIVATSTDSCDCACSCRVSQLSEVLRSGLNLQLALVHMKLTSLFLSMRVLLTAVQHIAVVPGRYVVGKQLEKHSSVEDGGKCCTYNLFLPFNCLPGFLFYPPLP
jgi:hypothetical protein